MLPNLQTIQVAFGVNHHQILWSGLYWSHSCVISNHTSLWKSNG